MIFYKNKSVLEWNIETHNKMALKYEKMHGEIYNEYEQSRLKNELILAFAEIKTSSEVKVALDYGCGAGNLTHHLSSLGSDVLAGDVSQGFLDLVISREYPTKVSGIKLNGTDLSNISDCSIDMVATYSVLHHVPNYLGIVREFIRVLKPGGIIYIDHEISEEFWLKKSIYNELIKKIKKNMPLNIKKYFLWTSYYDFFIRKLINPRYHREGDIHVFDDDHIEWSKIIECLSITDGEIIISKSYLLFRQGYDLTLYDLYKEKITDMQLLVFRKN